MRQATQILICTASQSSYNYILLFGKNGLLLQFLAETVNTFLTSVQHGWRHGAIIYFCINRKVLYSRMQILFLRFWLLCLLG